MDKDKIKNQFTNIQKIRGFLSYKIISAIVLSTFLSLLFIPSTIFIKEIFSSAIPSGNIGLLFKYGTIIIIFFAVQSLGAIWTRKLIIHETKKSVHRIRTSLSAKILNFSNSFYDWADISQLNKILIHDTERIDKTLNVLFSQVIPSSIICAILMIVLLWLDIQMGLIALLLIPVAFIIFKYIRKFQDKTQEMFRKKYEEFTSKSWFLIDMNKTIKVQNTYNPEFSAQEKISGELSSAGENKVMSHTLISQIQEVTLTTGSIGLLILCGIKVINGSMQIPTLMAFYFVLFLLKRYLTNINQEMPQLIDGLESLDYNFSIMNHEDSDVADEGLNINFNGKITFENVSFAYGPKEIFKNTSFVLHPHSVNLILGSNGIGKSTLVNLILQFYKHDKGEIFADDISINKLNVRNFRKQIGVVFQENHLFKGTLRDNLTYGVENINNDIIKDVLDFVGITEFINSLPQKLDSEIGESGSNISGGQKQKIILARAILKKPKLIILDEPTNNLDSESIQFLIPKLKNLEQEPTILIISHDLRIVDIADYIYSIHDRMIYKENVEDLNTKFINNGLIRGVIL